MTGPPGAPLTASPRAVVPSEIIRAPARARILVVGGPGAGKTWVLLARAAHLTSSEALSPAHVLVLSFTRAVADELRRRDRDLTERARVRPETFDAFATRILDACATDDAWVGAGYDGRIAAATQIIRDGSASPVLTDVRHILIDEVQDLVGVRAQFVEALLEAHESGFTAFGDPVQAIYDDATGGRREDLLRVIAEGDVTLATLDGNRRTSGRLAGQTAALREDLVSAGSDASRAARRAFATLPALGPIEVIAPTLATRDRTVAILCRDNATALHVAEALHRQQIRCHVRRPSVDRPVPGWVAALLLEEEFLTRAAADERAAHLSALGYPGLPPPSTIWELLHRVARSRNPDVIEARAVRIGIARGHLPWELITETTRDIIVSSIHRAKGLEFDDCVVIDWETRADEDPGLEARIRYVALTRARRDCWTATHDFPRRWFRDARAQNRFTKRGRQNWQRLGIEIRDDDVHGGEPGGMLLGDAPPTAIQSVLVESVRRGDPVELCHVGEHDFGDTIVPVYAVVHPAGTIGTTGLSFGQALRGCLRAWPRSIGGIRVHDLESVAGTTDVGRAASLGNGAIWVRPRLFGLGEFDWGR